MKKNLGNLMNWVVVVFSSFLFLIPSTVIFADLTFVHITDVQIPYIYLKKKQKPSARDVLRSMDYLKAFLEDLNELSPAFIINGGDIQVSAGPRFWEALKVYDANPVRVYYIPGNCDLWECGIRWNYIKKTFTIGDNLFILLTTTYERFHSGFLCWDQIVWLNRVLAANSDKNVFIFGHQITPANAPLINISELKKVLRIHRDRYRTICVIGGHIHCTTYVREEGIHYLTTKAAINGPFYAIFDVGKDKIEVRQGGPTKRVLALLEEYAGENGKKKAESLKAEGAKSSSFILTIPSFKKSFGPNLILHPSFELDYDKPVKKVPNWDVVKVAGNPEIGFLRNASHSGARGFRYKGISSSDEGYAISVPVKVKPEKTYTLRGYLRYDSPGQGYIGLRCYNRKGEVLKDMRPIKVTGSHNWHLCVEKLLLPPETFKVAVLCGGKGKGEIHIDDVYFGKVKEVLNE